MAEAVAALTLAEMRADGVHSVDLECECGHSAIVNVDHLPGEMPVPDVRSQGYTCSKCGKRPWRSMPNSLERKVAGVPDTRPKG